MEPVAIVIVLALIEYMYISFQVGKGRVKYNVPAPATSGDPTWERLYRVQLNTVEQFVIFLPSMWFFGLYVSPQIGAAIGLVWIAARAMYFVSYVNDAEKRTVGFVLGFLANIVLVVGSLIGAIRNLV